MNKNTRKRVLGRLNLQQYNGYFHFAAHKELSKHFPGIEMFKLILHL